MKLSNLNIPAKSLNEMRLCFLMACMIVEVVMVSMALFNGKVNDAIMLTLIIFAIGTFLFFTLVPYMWGIIEKENKSKGV